jgi:hypothetical protein
MPLSTVKTMAARITRISPRNPEVSFAVRRIDERGGGQ